MGSCPDTDVDPELLNNFVLSFICKMYSLTLYMLTSVCIFSILFPVHFLRCWQREFVEQSRVSVDDHVPYSCDFIM